MDAIFQSVDVSGLAGNISVILVALIGVALLFLGFHMVIKALGVPSSGSHLDPEWEEKLRRNDEELNR